LLIILRIVHNLCPATISRVPPTEFFRRSRQLTFGIKCYAKVTDSGCVQL
jgi:hypothetical protein